MRTPVVLVTGIDPEPMTQTLVSLAWDLPRAVAVRHEIDPESQLLTRTVSDATGVLEREQIELEHACVGCALREDIVPTLDRLARDGRWETVLACLPVGAETEQIGNVVAGDPRLQRFLRISAVVVALAGEETVDDLVGDDLLAERGHHTGPDDRRGVGEVGCALVEYADVVVMTGAPSAIATEFVTALARPDAQLVCGTENLQAATLVSGLYDHARTTGWATPGFDADVPAATFERVWRLELTSMRPFHTERLMADIEQIGSGRHRSRGRFWLPTRPGQIQVWDGSGGQLSIGAGEPWGRQLPQTRILLTGVGVEPAHLREAFERMLLSPEEALLAPVTRPVYEDGFEPWLGEISNVA